MPYGEQCFFSHFMDYTGYVVILKVNFLILTVGIWFATNIIPPYWNKFAGVLESTYKQDIFVQGHKNH
jgi:uncharacterized protein (DUF983 family)